VRGGACRTATTTARAESGGVNAGDAQIGAGGETAPPLRQRRQGRGSREEVLPCSAGAGGGGVGGQRLRRLPAGLGFGPGRAG
jgi:hypothetical protein